MNSNDATLKEEIEVDAAFEDAFMELLDSSDEEEEGTHRGSRKGKEPNKKRDFPMAHARVMSDYFNGTDSVCDEASGL